MKTKKEDNISKDLGEGYYYFLPKSMITKLKKKSKRKSEEDFERPRHPDEQDIGVDIVLRKLDKPFAELRLNALDYSRSIMLIVT